MIRIREFLIIFKDTGFDEKTLKAFYRSVRKSIVLKHIGKQSWNALFKLEEKYQWPVLRMLDDPNLSIYRGADITLLDMFLKTIKDEKTLREQTEEMKHQRFWIALSSIIEVRTELLKEIFGFCRKDLKRCELVAERYKKMLAQKGQSTRRLWYTGIGAGVATVAGTATYWYFSEKGKKRVP